MNETDMPTAMRVATTDGLGFGGAAKVAFARFHNRGGFGRDDRRAQSTMDHGRLYWGLWLWSSFLKPGTRLIVLIVMFLPKGLTTLVLAFKEKFCR
jgi:hypothetical protein